MTDSQIRASGQNLRTHFTQKAVLPEKEAARAGNFISALEKKMAAGANPSTGQIKTGQRILKSLEDQTTIFEFSFAQILAQEAASDGDIDKKIDAISQGLEQTQTMAQRLREKLQNYS